MFTRIVILSRAIREPAHNNGNEFLPTKFGTPSPFY